MTMLRFIAAAVLGATCLAAQAQSPVDTLSKCVADNTSGKDRKDLARWLFVAMGAHPEMRAIASIAPAASEDASRSAGQLFTRLLADSCPKEASAAVRASGQVAIQTAFGTLGQLAMQELMTDPEVAASMGRLQAHMDSSRIQAVLATP